MKYSSMFLLALVALFSGAASAFAQSGAFNFEFGTDQGWGTGFGNDASKNFPIVSVAASNWMETTLGGFQIAGRETTNPAEDVYQALLAASDNEAGYLFSYEWYLDTAPGGFGTFLQIGTFINTGSGYYAQNYPEIELNGEQLGSGQKFGGVVSLTFADRGYDIPSGETFFRPGLILNGDGASVKVYFDNIKFYPIVPEPTSLALLGLTASTLMVSCRRFGC
jgi:hypothetical protein